MGALRAAVYVCVVTVALLAQLGGGQAAGIEWHAEELLLQPLSDGALLAVFEFSSAAHLHARHTQGFPPALLRLVEQHGVSHLELALTRGRWASEQQQMLMSTAAAPVAPKPAGLELKVSFQPHVADTQAAYRALTQALGGLLCAGAAMVPQLAVMAAPTVGWWGSSQPPAAAAAGLAGGPGGRQVYAWLPQEAVCSENLAAWRRLLPCRERAGLGALLQPVRLAQAGYLSLSLQLWVAPAAGAGNASSSQGSEQGQRGQQQGVVVQLRQGLTTALPTATDAPSAAATAAAAAPAGQQAGLVHAAFGTSLPPACAAASSSYLYVAQPTGAGTSAAAAAAAAGGEEGSCESRHTPAGALLACDLRRAPVQLPARLLKTPGSGSGSQAPAQQASPGALHVVEHIVQRGSQAGTLVLGVRAVAAEESQPDKPSSSGSSGSSGTRPAALLHVMQLLPWQLLVNAGSLQVELDGQVLHTGSPELAWQAVDARPDRPAVVEILLRLPPVPAAPLQRQHPQWRELTVSVGFRPAFVGVFDHAPDASRGVDIPPALATLLPAACADNSSSSSSSWHSSGGEQDCGGDGGNDGDVSGSSGSGGSNSSAGLEAAAAAAAAAPLLQRLLSSCHVQQAYSNGGGGSVVPLPIPDFSMPFNVICFSSTLLAVLLGGTANAVLRSPQELAGMGAAAGGARAWKRKLRRLLALLLLMGVLAVYLDRDLQRQLDAALHRWVLGRHGAPEQHGEL